jgi:hypothetical protein
MNEKRIRQVPLFASLPDSEIDCMVQNFILIQALQSLVHGDATMVAIRIKPDA